MGGVARCTVSVVVPTRNEAPNVAVLTRRVGEALRDVPGGWELLFVDDSDDDTPEAVRALVDAGAPARLVHRPAGVRPGGLGGAVQEGFRAASGRVIVVMDADLQHPPEVLPTLVGPVLSGRADLVGGSRYGVGGGSGGLEGPWRRGVSWSCRRLAHRLVPASRELEDPLSGFFALGRSVLDGVELCPDGYKILLEVVARSNWQRTLNVSYVFASRYAGSSKAGLKEGLVFLRHLMRLALRRRRVPSAAVASAPAPPTALARAVVKTG